MLKYIAKRILEAIPVMFIIITAVFFMVRFVPGGPFDKERSVSKETVAAINAYYGLDKPLLTQYGVFLKNLLRGEFGPSYKYEGWSVNEILAEKAVVSLKLGSLALFIALLLGLSLGISSAALKDTKFGSVLSSVSVLGICLPTFVLGPILILLFSLKFKFFNAMGWNGIQDMILPAITLALFYVAWIARLARRSTIDEMSKGYVRTALAKGLSPSKIYWTHILRNSIQPVVSYLGPATAGLLTGSFVVETIFQISGLGRFFISSALDNDYTMIMGCVILYSAFIILFNLLADIMLALLNPKISKQL